MRESRMLGIFATDQHGNKEQITDLYWFEENMVHDWEGDGHGRQYTFEIFIEGKLVWDSKSGTFEAYKW